MFKAARLHSLSDVLVAVAVVVAYAPYWFQRGVGIKTRHDARISHSRILIHPFLTFSHLGENLPPVKRGLSSLSPVEGSPAFPNNPWRANVSKNLSNILYEKQKVGSSRRVTRLAGWPFFDGRVTLLAGPSPYKHFGSPSRVNSVKARQSEIARALLAWAKVSTFSSCNFSLKSCLGGRPSFLAQLFSINTRP